MSEVWNHLAAAIVRSRVPVVRIPTTRGHRFAGHSSMNFVALVTHGLSALAVFSDHLFVRVLVAATTISILGMVGVIVAVAVRTLTSLSIPGWATNAAGLAAIVVLQGLILSASAAFMILTSRSGLTFVPAIHAVSFIREIRRLNLR